MSFDWDAAQLALGTLRFDLGAQQPHPPGYPLWVAAIGAVGAAVGSVPLAQTILGLACVAGALAMLVRGVRPRLGAAPAAVLAVLVLVAAPVPLYAVAQGTYPVDLFASALLGTLAWRGWRGERRAVALAWPLAALLAGFRPSGVALLLPLLAAATWRAGRPGLHAAVLTAVFTLAIGLAWLCPLVASAGGVGRYVSLTVDLFRNTAGATSPLLGVDAGTSLRIGARFVVMLVAASAPLLVWAAAGRWTARVPVGFVALWLGPGLVFDALVHFAKPGYLLLLLPPLAWCASWAVPRRGAVIAGVVVGVVLAQYPWQRHDDPIARALAAQSPQVAVAAAAANADLRDALRALRPAQLVCPQEFREAAPNRRTVAYDFRDFPWREGGDVLHLAYRDNEVPAGAEVVHRGPGFVLWRAAPVSSARATADGRPRTG